LSNSVFNIQWHLTDACNYRCKHCYQSSYADNGISTEKAGLYLTQFQEFTKILSERNETNIRLHINFTGGEPFLLPNILDILAEARKIPKLSFGILSNGFLLPDSKFQILKRLRPSFIQLSLEGNAAVNDQIRGKGAFADVVKATQAYRQQGIPLMISFTANAQNYKQFPEVVKIARKLKVQKVWTDRYLPIKPKDDLTLTPEQAAEYFKLIRNEQKKKRLNPFLKTKISSERALQFLTSGGMPYKCKAGVSLLTLMPHGAVYPCRRLPIEIGNINTENILQIFDNQHKIKDLHDLEQLDESCRACFYKSTCAGGLRCLAYAKLGNYVKKDPDCSL